MIAAIYARKSTEQRGVTEEEKSVTRQIEHATKYAKDKGWVVSPEHIYSDDNVSGAEFEKKRPGFLRLMNALKPKPAFQVLIMSEESRLGREQIRTSMTLLQITEAGVRVFFYLTDQERKLDTAMDKIVLSLSNFGAELEREKASQRTHDALKKKALDLKVTGCKVFGYDNVEVCSPTTGERLHVVRRINTTEAEVVRRLFERYAAGAGLTRLAKGLNDEGVLPPRGDANGWAPSCIRAILHRPLYRGLVVWNKTQSIQRGGTMTARERPESEWLQVDAPDLRIIPEDLWRRVSKRMEKMSQVFARTPEGYICGHPSGADLRSLYLLSGMAKCGVCGGSLISFKRKPTEGHSLYVCNFHHHREPAICKNAVRMPQPRLDRAFLQALNQVLDEQMIAEAVQRALSKIRHLQTEFPEQRLALERQLSLVEAKIRHFVKEVGEGRMTDALYSELQQEEAKKKKLASQLDLVQQQMTLASLDSKQIERDLYARVKNVQGVLRGQIPVARQMVRKLIPGPIRCIPSEDMKGYRIEALGTYAGLLTVPPVSVFSMKSIGLTNGGGEGGI